MAATRVMLWCTTCVPGMQLPLFAAAAGGAFDRHGLDVELASPVAPRDMTLPGLAVRVNAVGAGEADFAVTGLAYLLAARAEAGGSVGARFVAPLHQRSPIAGIVVDGAAPGEPADLAGRRFAGHGLAWMVREYQAALAHQGLEPGAMADADDGAYAARSLVRREVDVSPAWADALPSMRRSAGAAFRAVPLDVGVYPSGLVAADTVPDEQAAAMTAALGDGLALQRAHPELGIEAYHRQYPKASKDDLRLAWALFEPNAPRADAAPSHQRWQASVAFYAAAFDLPRAAPDEVCRPELTGAVVPGDQPPAMDASAPGDQPPLVDTPAHDEHPPTVAADRG